MSATVHALPPADMRVPPHDLDAEAALLGAMLLNRQALEDGLDVCTPDDFYKPSHGHIFEAITKLHLAGQPTDAVTVSDALRRSGLLETCGGDAALVALQARTPATSRAGAYARIVAEHAALRSLIGVGNEIAELGYELPDDVAATIDRAEQMLAKVADRATASGGPLLLSSTIGGWYDELAEAAEAGTVPGVLTGWLDLDEILAGLRPGQLITVAARPGVGKSAVAVALGLNVAAQGKGVIFWSLEMSRKELSDRFTSVESGVHLDRIRDPRKLAEKDWSALLTSVGAIEALPLHVDDDPAATVLGIRAATRRMRHEVGLVIVDYVQLLKSTSKAENRQVEVSEITRGLKRAALELGVPIVMLAQLNRNLEMRTDKRPQLADLRESGSIENDSDVVVMLYAEEIHRPDTDQKGILELIVTKHRNGPTGTAKLAYDRTTGRVRNMARVG